MAVFNYRSDVVTKKSDDPRFKDERVQSGMVVGLLVEEVLKLELRPEGRLPVPVEAQGSKHHTAVLIHKALAPGS